MIGKENIEGKIFGKLTALYFVREKLIGKKSKVKRHIWLCKCTCGNTCETTSQYLINGNTKSCGCLKHEAIIRVGKNNTLGFSVASRNCILNNYKQSAKKKGLKWELTYEQFCEITQSNCKYCDTTPKQTATGGKSCNGHYTYNGIDRVDSTKGYIYSNCVPCCKYCNFSKNNLSLEDFKNHIEKIYKTLFNE